MANAHLLQLSKVLLLTSYSFKKELLHCLKQKQRKTRCFCKTNMCKIKVKESKNKQINKQKQANGNGIKRKIKEKNSVEAKSKPQQKIFLMTFSLYTSKVLAMVVIVQGKLNHHFSKAFKYSYRCQGVEIIIFLRLLGS